MRRIVLAMLLLLLVPPVVLAAPYSKGPFAGVVAEGATKEHPYTNNPNPNAACLDYPWGSYRPYRLALAYEPATDRVDAVYAGMRAVGENGVATLSFWGPNCIRGSIYVQGISVTAPYAAYEVGILDLAPTPAAVDDALRP